MLKKANCSLTARSTKLIYTKRLGLDGTSLEEVKRLLRADYLSNVTVEETKMTTEIFNDTNYPYTMEHTQRLFIDRRFRLRKPFKRLAEGWVILCYCTAELYVGQGFPGRAGFGPKVDQNFGLN